MPRRVAGRIPLNSFKRLIWKEYDLDGRRHLPWRHTKNPYHILVSEVMLQQTQVSRVLTKYPSFLEDFPNFRTLQKAKVLDVLRAWQGLGYNRRALSLKKIADIIVSEHKGELPRETHALVRLPGIGEATAGAIQAFAWNMPSVFIETNIRRVFLSFFFKHRRKVSDAMILPLIQATLDRKNPREWYWALMDYGSMLGRAVGRKNPNQRSAHYIRQPAFRGSKREIRGRVVSELLKARQMSVQELAKKLNKQPAIVRDVAEDLEREGFVHLVKETVIMAS